MSTTHPINDRVESMRHSTGNLVDAHWFPLASQGNIYSMTKLCSSVGSNKLLVASLKRKIYSYEYNRTPKSSHPHLRPLVKELLFTYIPSGAEIISIDAYNKSEKGDEFVIGITIMKASHDATVERYLNIYTEGEGDGESYENSTIETVAQNCLMVELSYTPYHLYHTSMPTGAHSSHEMVWLLSGNDYKIHMIREDKGSHDYAESPLEKYFPELMNLEAIATWIDIYYYKHHTRRLTAVGCECGLVKVSLVNVEEMKIIRNWALRYDKPVSSIRIFRNENHLPEPKFLRDTEYVEENHKDELPALNVLVVNAVYASVVFTDVLHNDMRKDVKLAGSEFSDCVLCSCIADINMDGKNEILLGTYNQEVLVYTLVDDTWEFTERRLFDAPVHSMGYLDLTGDGMKELAVLTQRGVHILQHDPGEVKKNFAQRLRKYMAIERFE